MNSDSSTQFSFAFLLAILFHLSLIFLVVLGLSFEPEIVATNPIAVMQATILEAPPAEEAEENVPESAKNLSRAEKKRLAQAKKQALRIEQAEKKKLLAEVAQKLVLETIQAKKYAQEIAAIEGKIKTLWHRPAGTKGMSCVIQVELSANGQLKKASIQQSSGNKFFDESAKSAVYKAERIQIPDDEKLRQKMQEGISLHFGNE